MTQGKQVSPQDNSSRTASRPNNLAGVQLEPEDQVLLARIVTELDGPQDLDKVSRLTSRTKKTRQKRQLSKYYM